MSALLLLGKMVAAYLGVAVAVGCMRGVINGLDWLFGRPYRHVCVENVDNHYYKLCIEYGEKRDWVTLPAQDLPAVISWFERMNKNSPIKLSFQSYVDPEHRSELTVLPWANRRMLRLLRKHYRTWAPAHFFSRSVRQGPYR